MQISTLETIPQTRIYLPRLIFPPDFCVICELFCARLKYLSNPVDMLQSIVVRDPYPEDTVVTRHRRLAQNLWIPFEKTDRGTFRC